MSTCPVCLVASSPSIELACGHALCHACGTAAAAFGIEACPVCRRASVLDPALLRAESAAWRSSYQNWRAGREKGAAGEVTSVSAPKHRHEPSVLYSKAVGDLHIYRPQTGVLHSSSSGALGRTMDAPLCKGKASEASDEGGGGAGGELYPGNPSPDMWEEMTAAPISTQLPMIMFPDRTDESGIMTWTRGESDVVRYRIIPVEEAERLGGDGGLVERQKGCLTPNDGAWTFARWLSTIGLWGLSNVFFLTSSKSGRMPVSLLGFGLILGWLLGQTASALATLGVGGAARACASTRHMRPTRWCRGGRNGVAKISLFCLPALSVLGYTLYHYAMEGGVPVAIAQNVTMAAMLLLPIVIGQIYQKEQIGALNILMVLGVLGGCAMISSGVNTTTTMNGTAAGVNSSSGTGNGSLRGDNGGGHVVKTTVGYVGYLSLAGVAIVWAVSTTVVTFASKELPPT